MPNLKGLQHVHSFACERLERLVFDVTLPREQVLAFGYLYGQAMGLSPITGEGAALAVENLYVNLVVTIAYSTVCFEVRVTQKYHCAFYSESRAQIIFSSNPIFPPYSVKFRRVHSATRFAPDNTSMRRCIVLM